MKLNELILEKDRQLADGEFYQDVITCAKYAEKWLNQEIEKVFAGFNVITLIRDQPAPQVHRLLTYILSLKDGYRLEEGTGRAVKI